MRLTSITKTSSSDTIPEDNSTTETVSVGSTETGAINIVGDKDWFAINLIAGQSYVFDMAGNPFFDTDLSLYDSSGNEVAHNDNRGYVIHNFSGYTMNEEFTLQSQFVYTPDISSTFYIQAAGSTNPTSTSFSSYFQNYFDVTGVYDLNVTVLEDYFTPNSSILPPSSIELIPIELIEGQTYQFTLHTSAGFDAMDIPFVKLSLFGTDGITVIATNYGGGDQSNDYTADISYTVTVTGTYYIDVAGGYSGLRNTLTNGSLVNIIDGTGQDETLYGTDEGDLINGLDGADIIVAGLADDRVYGNDGSDWLYGGSGNDTLYGGAGATDVLLGQDGDDILYGGDGFDYLYGYADHDIIHGGNDVDVAYGGTGADFIYGEAATDWLFGEDDADALYGGESSDLLIGGQGGDFINGGTGNDWLWGDDITAVGGGGADTFAFYDNWGVDVIYDFENGIDHIYFNTANVNSFADLTIGQIQGGFTWVTDGTNVIYLAAATGQSLTAADLTADDFSF